jgi:hypothetical protein
LTRTGNSLPYGLVLSGFVGGGLIDLAGKNYAILWLFSAIYMALAILMMMQVQARRPLPAVYAVAEVEVED